jgi:long-chain acyl-CoA synthetase
LTYFAILSIGGVLVPLDAEWKAEDLAQTALAADTSFVFCDEALAEKARFIADTVSLEAPPVYLRAKEQENNLIALKAKGEMKFLKDPDVYFDTPIDSEKMSLLVFTSGTTGKGKGVMLSQEAILSDLAEVIQYVAFTKKTIGVLPPHHTYGSSVMLIGHVMIGCEVYISAGLKYITKELKEQKPGHLILVPLYLETFYRKILSTVKRQGKEDLLRRMMKLSKGLRKTKIDLRNKLFSSVREAFGGELNLIISGGAPISSEIVDFFDAIGISTLNGYGITECAPIVSVNRSKRIIPGSVGPVLSIDSVKIDNPNEDGEGEILVKGSNVMLGYYKDQEATAAAFDKNGYFRTGDYGKLDENNVLFITGRKKNLIILSNGKNVYPEEIENELMAVPGVLEIVVYEGQSRRGIAQNAIVAEIYPDYDYYEKSGITDVKKHLKYYVDEYNKKAVSYKRIGIVKVRKDEFPKNTLRKIMRFKLDMTID